MDPKDLRIGDIIKTNDKTPGTNKRELYIVTEIDSEVNMLQKDGTYLKGGVDIIDIKRKNNRYIGTWIDYLIPISITEKLIKKLGFTKHDNKYVDWEEYELATEKGFIQISNISNTVGKDWSVHIDNLDHDTNGGMDIQYLHEL